MLTTLLILIPFAGSLATLLAKGHARTVAILFSLVQFAATVYLLSIFDPAAGTQFNEQCSWIPSLGISYKVGIDGISLIMVLLTNLAVPLILGSAAGKNYHRSHIFYALAMLMQSALVGVFVSLDAFLYYIFWELALIPIFFILLGWGGPNRQPVTIKFFIYTLAGSLLMLVGFILLYQSAGNFDISSFYGLDLDSARQTLIFFLLFSAFAIKMPIFPLHTWQPSTYTEAPAQGTMLLSGIMLKMGIYSVFRWILPVLPLAVAQWSHLIIALAVIGIVYGSWIAIRQQDIKTLFAYASFAHVGLIAAGMFTNNEQGLQGALIQSLVHGINAIGLFYCADIIEQRLGNRNVDGKGGIRLKAPQFATLFIIITLGTVALPLTNGFVGEFLLLLGLGSYSLVWAAIAGLTIIFCAVYMLRMYQRVVLGENQQENFVFADLTFTEKIVLGTIAVLVVGIGVYPQPLLELTGPAVTQLLQQINA
jgi:NADH-quinone oxidoreductase subunit M